MRSLCEQKHFVWCLFAGHLALEKILKSIYTEEYKESPPRTHDLVKLAQKLSINFSSAKLDFLDEVNDFNIEARYPDYKLSIYKTATDEYTKLKIEQIEEEFKWLRSQLK
ncbi:MAG: HEPN domain-containing protein [Bacteroidetes bacterium]|nr:HEPN domain-containing protein [Bacteroidota bacterium]